MTIEKEDYLSPLRGSIDRLNDHYESLLTRYRDVRKQNSEAPTLPSCVLCEEDLLREHIEETRQLRLQFDEEYQDLSKRQA